MELGPVELVLLTFPGERTDAAVVAALDAVVRQGHVTILDLVVVTSDAAGDLRRTDFDDDLSGAGLDRLRLEGRPLLSDDDLELVRDCLPPSSTAVVVVYEESWARHLAGTVRSAGGEVALHVQLPRETVDLALDAAPVS
ncbi:MAG TPA: DUF6325 family protein [Mycobacteriales bacterium]